MLAPVSIEEREGVPWMVTFAPASTPPDSWTG